MTVTIHIILNIVCILLPAGQQLLSSCLAGDGAQVFALLPLRYTPALDHSLTWNTSKTNGYLRSVEQDPGLAPLASLSFLIHPFLPISVVWYDAHEPRRRHLDYYGCGKLFPAKSNGTLRCYPLPHLITNVFSGGNAVLSVVDMLSISHHCLEIEHRVQKPTGTSSACEASSQLLAWLVPALCQNPFPSLYPWIPHCLVSHSCWSLSLC